MFLVINLALQAGLLCLFINYFTRETSADEGFKKALIVVGLATLANIILSLTLGGILGLLIVFIHIAIVYFLIGWICQTSNRTTAWICGSYFAASLLLNILFRTLLT